MTGFQWVGVLLEKTVVWSLTIIELIVAAESFILQYIFARVSDPHFFADPDPGKNLHADPDPGGIRGVKGKNEFFFWLFHVSDVSEQLLKIYEIFFGPKLPETDD